MITNCVNYNYNKPYVDNDDYKNEEYENQVEQIENTCVQFEWPNPLS